MAIEVTCPSCLARFQVSDKFAGKKGPCPKCKGQITIPDKKEEVVIHAPADSGPTDSKGVSVLKPLVRQETKLSRTGIIVIAVSVVAVLLVALVLRGKLYGGKDPQQMLILSIGAVLLAPLVSFAGYTFLRDDELEPYRGGELALRLLACTIIYPLLWGAYAFVFWYLEIPPNPMYMLVIVPAAVFAGGVAASSSLDLEMGTGAMHYSMYLIVTVVLRLIMGLSPS